MTPKPIAAVLRRRALLLLPLLVALVAALSLLAWFGRTPADAATQNQATIVVEVDGQGSIVRAITFTDPISGLKALQLSGLEIITSETGFGPAVCSINGVGCPADNCFCNSKYWGNSRWDGSTWQPYPVGASSTVISATGAADGWFWAEFGATPAPFTPTQQALSAIGWLNARQTMTGSFGSAGATIESLLALGANDLAADSIRRAPDGLTAEGYLSGAGASFSRTSAGAAGKLATALIAANSCTPYGSLTPSAFYSATIGAYSSSTGQNAWALLGAVAISETIPAPALNSLQTQQLAGGGWEWAAGFGADTNSTALAIQALIATGQPVTATTVLSGLAWLDGAQNSNGGFPYAPGAAATSDVNSTAYVLQALAAAGEDPSAARWTAAGGSALDYLHSMQLADGSFEWVPGSGANQLATQQAIPALLGRAFPTRVATPTACPARMLPLVRNN